MADIHYAGQRPSDRYQMPENLQEELITLLTFDNERAQKIRARVAATSFEGANKEIAHAIYPYLDEHGKAPGVHLDTLLGPKLAEPKHGSKRFKRVLRTIKQIYEASSFNPDHVMGKLDDFVQHQSLREATRELLGVFNSNTPIDATTVTQLREIMQTALDHTTRPYGGQLASSISPRDTEFLWHPYLVAGEINIIAGRGNVGKGVMLANIAATVVLGREWPDKSGRAPKGHVLWAEDEDDFASAIVPRLMGNDLSGRLLQRVSLFDRDGYLRLDLKTFVREKDVKLIVLSPLNSFLPNMKNTNDEMAVRAALARLHDAVQGTDCAVAAIMHLSKKTDLDSIERVLGSGAYVNFSRSVLLLNQDQENERLRRVVHAKHNLSERGHDLLFEITNADSERHTQYLYTTWYQVPNGQDVVVDRFLDRGSTKPASKLSDDDKAAIRLRYEDGESAYAIAPDYPVSRQWIAKLARDEGWKQEKLVN